MIHKNEELSISFLGVFFSTSLISLIFMTSHGLFLTQFGFCPYDFQKNCKNYKIEEVIFFHTDV